jgi:hypothetical protein
MQSAGDSKSSSQSAGVVGRWCVLTGAALFLVAACISVVSTVWTGDYEALGKVSVGLSIMGYFAYRAVRGVVGTGIATCISGALVLGVVGFIFVPSGVSHYRKEHDIERLKPIAAKYKVEMTELGRGLAKMLDDCQVDAAYSMLGGRGAITAKKLLHLQTRVDTALKGLNEFRSQSEALMQAEKQEAFAIGNTDTVRAFVSGVDRGLSALNNVFQIQLEFYGQMHAVVEFLAYRPDAYHGDGQRLIFTKQADSREFARKLTALYEARKAVSQIQ